MIKMTNNLEPDIMCRRITGVDDVVQISLFCVCYLLHLEVWYIVMYQVRFIENQVG